MNNFFILTSGGASPPAGELSGTSGGVTKTFGNTSVSSNFTIPSYTGDAVLLVGTYGDGLPTGITWNGSGLTIIDTVTQGSRSARVYRIDNPAIGTFNLTMSATSTADIMMGHIAFDGMDSPTTGTSTTTTGSGTTSSLSLTAGVNDIVFAAFSGSGSNDFTASLGTMIYDDRITSISGIVMWRQGQGGSTTISATHGSMSWRGAGVVGESI